MSERTRPFGYQWLAGAALLTALVAYALLRIECIDTPVHLATARLAFAEGHFPATNRFSYTHPGYPLYQQYPIFQAVLWGVYRAGSWEGLSLLLCGGWLGAFLLFVRWAGPLAAAALRPLLWTLALLAMQRRILLRPDLFSTLAMALELLAIDAFLRGRRRAIAAVPLVHWFWVNSHQLFPISWALQGLLVVHLLAARFGLRGFARDDRAVPIAPALGSLGASALVTLVSPLGARTFTAVFHTAGSLGAHRPDVQEFALIWHTPYEGLLAFLALAVVVHALWRSRGRWHVFDLGVWLLSLLLVAAAMRGIALFGLVSVAVCQRARRREPTPARPAMPLVAAMATLVVAATVIHFRWLAPPLVLGGTQPGLGRSRGDWPDGAIDFLRRDPPPGRMLNFPWSSGNALIWGLPAEPVFVDPRFEAYPRDFLRRAISSITNDTILAHQIAEHRPGWIFGEHCRGGSTRDRLAHLLDDGGWAPVYVDASALVLVRDEPANSAYLAQHRLARLPGDPPGLMSEPAVLRARQRLCYGELLTATHDIAAARRQFTLAAEEGREDEDIRNKAAKLAAE